MTTPDPRQRILAGLLTRIDNVEPTLNRLDRYYDGRQPLNFLAPTVRAQVGNRLTSLVINWPRVIADSVQRRTYVEGFRVGDSGAVDSELARLWQENDLDEASQLAQLDALVHGSAFLMVWGNDRDPLTPRITVESAHQVAVARRPGSREVEYAVKRWTDGERIYATLYLADEIIAYSMPMPDSGVIAPWRVDDVIDNPLGAVPVVPLVNRPRLLKPDGESELTDVMPLADAVNKLATDMMVTSEYHAEPRRTATGLQISANPAERERFRAEVREHMDALEKGRTMLGGVGVDIGQLPAASLDNFVNAISLLTAQIAAVAGLPPHFLGINTENPASADAIRAAEATLVERAHEKQRTWSGAYEQAMRLAVAARDGIRLDGVPGELRRMETVWRDPATPTPAQSMDAAVKGITAGIYDDVAAQEAVGLSPQQRDAIRDRRETATVTAATADVQAKLALARQLVAADGLTFNAALAAVGLLQAAGLNAAE